MQNSCYCIPQLVYILIAMDKDWLQTHKPDIHWEQDQFFFSLESFNTICRKYALPASRKMAC